MNAGSLTYAIFSILHELYHQVLLAIFMRAPAKILSKLLGPISETRAFTVARARYSNIYAEIYEVRDIFEELFSVFEMIADV